MDTISYNKYKTKINQQNEIHMKNNKHIRDIHIELQVVNCNDRVYT